jgi:hypothetical protein
MDARIDEWMNWFIGTCMTDPTPLRVRKEGDTTGCKNFSQKSQIEKLESPKTHHIHEMHAQEVHADKEHPRNVILMRHRPKRYAHDVQAQ